jgi:hypothetical protein
VKLGAFAIKTDSDSGDSLKPGSLFAKKDKVEEPPLQGKLSHLHSISMMN